MLSIDWHGRSYIRFTEANKPVPPSAEPEDFRLTISKNGDVLYRVSRWESCSKDPQNCDSWFLIWDGSTERVFRGKIDPADMNRLRLLISRLDLRLFDHGEALANSGPSVGDLRMSISGPTGDHRLTFLGLFPPDRRDPEQHHPLYDLICEAWTVAQQISKSGGPPEWCSGKPGK